MSRRSTVELSTKLKAIQSYQQGTERVTGIAKKAGVHPQTVRQWTRDFEQWGPGGLEEHLRNRSYTKEFKIEAVEAYLRGEGSLQEICYAEGISSKKQLRVWLKKYNGHEEIRDYDPKGEIYMTKGRETTKEERIEIVNWCLRHEKSYKLAAERYQVSYSQVYAWVRKYLQDGEERLRDSRGRRKPEAELSPEEKQARELKRLQAENQRLKMENEVLKKVKEIERKLYMERYGKKRNTSR